MDMDLSKLWEIVEDRREVGVLQSMGSQRVGHHLATEPQWLVFEFVILYACALTHQSKNSLWIDIVSFHLSPNTCHIPGMPEKSDHICKHISTRMLHF